MGLKTVWVKFELFGSDILIMTLLFTLVYSYLYHAVTYIFHTLIVLITKLVSNLIRICIIFTLENYLVFVCIGQLLPRAAKLVCEEASVHIVIQVALDVGTHGIVV
jgi:hypothetical protein